MSLPVRHGISRLPSIVEAALRDDPGRPLITYYDDATGERVQVSAGVLGNWVTSTANMLVHGCGLRQGARVAIGLPPHWQTAAVTLAAWSVGASVDLHLAATAGLPRIGAGANRSTDVTFFAVDRLNDLIEQVPEAPVRFALGLAPLGAPTRDLPEGYRDFVTEVLTHGGALHPESLIRAEDPATVDGTTYREWGSLAKALAERWGLRRGDRVLVDAAELEHPVKWLLAPFSAGASVVLCANLDHGLLAARQKLERVTRVL